MSMRYIPPKQTKDQKLQKQIDKKKSELTGFNGPESKLNKYEIGTKEYNIAAAAAKRLREDIKALEKQLAQSKLKSTQDSKQRAIDSGNTDEANRIQENIDDLVAIINDSNDPKIKGPLFIEGDNFGNAIRKAGLAVDTDPDSGNSTLMSDDTIDYEDAGKEHLIWMGKGFQSKLPGFSSIADNMQIGVSYNQIEKKILEDAQSKPGGMQALFDRMYKAGLISKKTYASKSTTENDFTRNLLYALREYSKKTVRDYELNDIKEPITFDEYLDKEFTPEGPQVSYDSITTDRATAASDLNRFIMQYLGVGASKEQQDKYYKELRKLERKAVKTTTTSETDSGGTSQNFAGEFIDEIDKMELMRKIAGKALAGSDIDVILKGGAKAAQDVNGVLAYAKRYGINLNNKDALGYVANELRKGQADLKKIDAKILAISKATYGNLSDVISEDVSLAELASNYKYNMAQVLELNPDSIDVMDSSIQTALKNNGNKGAMNLTDFDRMLRNDPRWGKTKNAREEASKYAYDILKDFGLMA